MFRRRRRSRLNELTLNAVAFAWILRGAWRMSRGRAPWRAAIAGKQGRTHE